MKIVNLHFDREFPTTVYLKSIELKRMPDEECVAILNLARLTEAIPIPSTKFDGLSYYAIVIDDDAKFVRFTEPFEIL